MKFGRIRFQLPLLALSVLAIAGCGSSSSKSTRSSAAPAAASSSSTTSTSTTQSASAPGTSSGAEAVTVTTKHNDKLGTILGAGKKKLTVYLFEKDKGSKSACEGACASAWPPVTGKAMAAGKASAADLGTTKRSDGTTQVTYKGHPLYFFIKDKDGEDAYGQNAHAFGADWYVLSPSGNKVDKS
jgi:predicted lipoprotein with Yx(FWY)xxD motif